MLSLLLARAGIPVTLLEAHKDFDRDFRGDTIHSSTLEVLDQVGLSDRLHELPHSKTRELRFVSPTAVFCNGWILPAADPVPLHDDDAAVAVPGLPGRRS